MTDGHDELAHQEALALLPFLVNGTLADDERERLQMHLRACAACRRELAGEQALAGAYAAMTVAVPDSAPALGRLLATLKADAAAPAAVLPFVRPAAPARRGWAPLAAAATVALTVALGTLTSVQVARQSAAPGYRALASADGTTPSLPGALNIVIAPTLVQADLERLLHGLPVTAIAPRAQPGTYQVQLDHGTATAATLAAAAASLAGQSGILFVAPASPLAAGADR